VAGAFATGVRILFFGLAAGFDTCMAPRFHLFDLCHPVPGRRIKGLMTAYSPLLGYLSSNHVSLLCERLFSDNRLHRMR